MKLFGEHLNSEESYANGPALAKRIDDVFFGVSNEMTESVDRCLPKVNICQDINSRSSTIDRHHIVFQEVLIAVLIALILLSTICAAIYAAKIFTIADNPVP